MSDEPFYGPTHKRPQREGTAGERLFDYIRAYDQTPMSCELQNQGEFGWEVQLLERGERSQARGGFATRALAAEWAEAARRALERSAEGPQAQDGPSLVNGPHGPLTAAWLPTAANINALPFPLRRYIHDLETRADPAGDVRARIELEDVVKRLEAQVAELLRDRTEEVVRMQAARKAK